MEMFELWRFNSIISAFKGQRIKIELMRVSTYRGSNYGDSTVLVSHFSTFLCVLFTHCSFEWIQYGGDKIQIVF